MVLIVESGVNLSRAGAEVAAVVVLLIRESEQLLGLDNRVAVAEKRVIDHAPTLPRTNLTSLKRQAHVVVRAVQHDIVFMKRGGALTFVWVLAHEKLEDYARSQVLAPRAADCVMEACLAISMAGLNCDE